MTNYLSELYQKLSGQMKLGLERSKVLMQGLSHPERVFRSVHIAGTNGKGSVVAITVAFLQAAGLRIGRFTSPHLIHFNERIQVNGKAISEQAVQDFLEKERELLDKAGASFFEVTTAMAFDYFRKEKVDVAVVESGLGGRLDATNVLQPEVVVISSLGRDHMESLGNSLEEIAEEKAGIIKEGAKVITCEQAPEVLEVFHKHSKEIEIVRSKAMFGTPGLTPVGMRFLIRDYGRYFSIPLVGRFQLANIGMAMKAAQHILKRPLEGREMERAFRDLVWKGRFERLGRNPDLIYDVAHNPDGVRVFCETLEEVYPQKRRYAVLGVLKDKEPAEILGILKKTAEHIWICPLPSHRSMGMAELEELAKSYPGVSLAKSISQACDVALAATGKEDVLAVLGSHYIAEELYRWNKARAEQK